MLATGGFATAVFVAGTFAGAGGGTDDPGEGGAGQEMSVQARGLGAAASLVPERVRGEGFRGVGDALVLMRAQRSKGRSVGWTTRDIGDPGVLGEAP